MKNLEKKMLYPLQPLEQFQMISQRLLQHIDADISGGDLILTGWTPHSIKEGTIVQLRKTDNSANKIVFNDGGIEYTFCEARGEFVKLIWTDSGFKIT